MPAGGQQGDLDPARSELRGQIGHYTFGSAHQGPETPRYQHQPEGTHAGDSLAMSSGSSTTTEGKLRYRSMYFRP